MSVYVKFLEETVLHTSLGVPVKFRKFNEYKMIKQDNNHYWLSNIKLKYHRNFCMSVNGTVEGLCKIAKDSYLIEAYTNNKVMTPLVTTSSRITDQERRLIILKTYLKNGTESRSN